ncbi:MAG TPA: 2-oxoglutarate and iron-dependent oxygenase domain-containing protein [Roseiflexaceae bacterium]|nr:2-oxoglutarate and iron-dependent oxygenase domain-containing protein [Roseiflexaceae bacterium]
MTQTTVPVIDLSPYRSGTASGKQAVAQAVGAAREQIGFLTIVGHGVPEELIARTADVSRRFFDLPMEEKLKVRVNAVGVGYVPLQIESLAASLGKQTPGDLKESLNTGLDFSHDRWPAEPAELRAIYINYFETLNQLATMIMRIFALALDLPEHYFDDKIDNPLAFMRVINYPDQPDDPLPGQLRAGEHTDYGTLTILRPENVPGGLQVRNRAGEWLDVATVPGSFVINIGDAMQYWTNDRWISTVHRVMNPPRDKSVGSRRQSIVFFHTPNDDTLISCLESCCSAENPPRYAPVLAGEHLRRKSAQAGTLDKPAM